MNSTAIDTNLTDSVAALIREIEAIETARVPVDQEVSAELAHLDLIAARGDVSGGLWLSTNPNFSERAFTDSLLAILAAIAPQQTKQLVADRTRRRAEAWSGLRMTAVEKERRLSRLQTDLRVARARLEQQRREAEARTNDVLPRVGDDPAIWLLPDAQLDALASNGRTAR